MVVAYRAIMLVSDEFSQWHVRPGEREGPRANSIISYGISSVTNLQHNHSIPSIFSV